MSMNLKFGELRKYISRTDRVSICMHENNSLPYKNYRFIKDVPDHYDDYYVFGVGLIDSEFRLDEFSPEFHVEKRRVNEGYYLAKCIEIMLKDTPRDEYYKKLQDES